MQMGVEWCKLYCDILWLWINIQGSVQKEHKLTTLHILTSHTSWSNNRVQKQSKSKWFDSLPTQWCVFMCLPHHSLILTSLSLLEWLHTVESRTGPRLGSDKNPAILSNAASCGIAWHHAHINHSHWKALERYNECNVNNISKFSKVRQVQISTKLRQGCIIYISIEFQCQRPHKGDESVTKHSDSGFRKGHQDWKAVEIWILCTASSQILKCTKIVFPWNKKRKKTEKTKLKKQNKCKDKRQKKKRKK